MPETPTEQEPNEDYHYYKPTPEDLARLENTFTYHAPKGNQTGRYAMLRSTARGLAQDILEATPKSREQSLALTHLEEAIFWANAAIARNE
jgi:hypothetical protein